MRKHMRYDQLDTEELEQLQNDSYLEKWKKKFCYTFF